MKSNSSREFLRIEHLLLILLIGGFMGITALFLHLHCGPASWDDAWYLDDSLRMFDALKLHGPRGWVYYFLFNTQARLKAPLLCALPTLLYLVTGRDFHHALYLNVLFMPFLLVGVFAIARRYFSARTALLAVFITGSMPQMYGLATWFMVEYGLATFTVLAIVCLLYSQDLHRLGWVALFSAVCGLGLLQKIFFPVFVAPLLLYILYRWIRHRRHGQAPLASATLAALLAPALLIAGPWYSINGAIAVHRALFSGYDKLEAGLHGTGDPFTLPAIAKYLVNVANQGIGATYACGFILVLAILASRRLFAGSARRTIPHTPESIQSAHLAQIDYHPRPSNKPPFRYIALFWLVSFLIFLFGLNKLMRFIAPLLPLFAICFAIVLDRFISQARKSGWGLTALTLGFGLFCQLQICFQPIQGLELSLPQNPSSWRTSRGLCFAASEIDSARAYESQPWPTAQLLKTLLRDDSDANTRARLMLSCDSFHFNYFNVSLIATQENLPIDVETTAYYTDPDKLKADIARCNLFLASTGGEPSFPLYNTLKNVALDQVSDPLRFEASPSQIDFPDQRTLTIYRNLTLKSP